MGFLTAAPMSFVQCTEITVVTWHNAQKATMAACRTATNLKPMFCQAQRQSTTKVSVEWQVGGRLSTEALRPAPQLKNNHQVKQDC